ncbi:MAG TPA: hypothetical protein VGK94_00335 [Candidatus Polarisedimenticolia bacterium]|jgi:hypothetical protein
MRRTRIGPAPAFLAAALPLLLGANHSDNFYLTPDVPTDLGSTTVLPWQISRNDAGAYSAILTLPPGTAIDALHRMDDGHWLLSVESPAILGGIAAAPSDVLELYDYPGGYAERFDGVASGVPLNVNVDAVFLDGGDAGDLVLSFDVPATIGGQTFDPADLVRFDGSAFSLFLDASATVPPIPPTTNVTGADRRGPLTILTFDVPTTLDGQTFLPGQLVSWDGSGFSSFYMDPGWPAGSGIDALALLPQPGAVPPTIDVALASPPGGRLRLRITWEASCSAGAEDYAIYEGTIGSWYSHGALDCSDDGGDRMEEFSPGSGNRYYLVVPLNANDEGSYGVDTAMQEIPRGATTCVPTQALGACQ